MVRRQGQPAFRTFGAPLPGVSSEQSALITQVLYASCVVVMMCAWGYLAMERWHGGRPSRLTTLVFAALMVGLGAIFAVFHYQHYHDVLQTARGRLHAVTAALEFAVLVTGLLCTLLREPSPVVAMLVGAVLLMAGDMPYSLGEVPPLVETGWMLRQFLLLSAVIGMPEALTRPTGRPVPVSPPAEAGRSGRSGLSGVLILISLGAVLLAPLGRLDRTTSALPRGARNAESSLEVAGLGNAVAHNSFQANGGVNICFVEGNVDGGGNRYPPMSFECL